MITTPSALGATHVALDHRFGLGHCYYVLARRSPPEKEAAGGGNVYKKSIKSVTWIVQMRRQL